MKTIQTWTSKSRAMLPKRLVAMLRMVLGYTLGIIGFATLSLGFVHLSGTQILVGLARGRSRDRGHPRIDGAAPGEACPRLSPPRRLVKYAKGSAESFRTALGPPGVLVPSALRPAGMSDQSPR